MVNTPAAQRRLERFLEELLPRTWSASWTWQPRARDGANRPDAALKLTPPGCPPISMTVEVKSRLLPAEVVNQLGRYEGAARLLVAPRISERVRALFDKAAINWIDLRGDCRIVADGVLIDRRGAPDDEPDDLALAPRTVADLFSGKALRVVRWLLIDQDRRWGVIDMAARAGASPGFVSRTFRTLERDAYVRRDPSGVALADRDSLLDAWANAPPPPERREEGVSLAGTASAVLGRVAEETAPNEYALTAEAAAEQVAPFARFNRVEMYVRDSERWKRSLELTPVPVGGNVVLIEPADPGVFDGAFRVEPTRLQLVSLPQLYVDLQRRTGAADAAAFLKQRLDKIRRTNLIGTNRAR